MFKAFKITTILMILSCVPAIADVHYLYGQQEAVYTVPELEGQLSLPDYQNYNYKQQVTDEDGTLTIKVTSTFKQISSRAVLPKPKKLNSYMNRDFDKGLKNIFEQLSIDVYTEMQFVNAVMEWMTRYFHHVERPVGETKEIDAIMESRTGNCVDLCLIAKSLLDAHNIPNRIVHGLKIDFVAQNKMKASFHRWLEVKYDDLGWVFYNPLESNHLVFATHIVIAIEDSDIPFKEDGLPKDILDKITVQKLDSNYFTTDIEEAAGSRLVSVSNSRSRFKACIYGKVAKTGPDYLTDKFIEIYLGKNLIKRIPAIRIFSFPGLEGGMYEVQYVDAKDNLLFKKRISVKDRDLTYVPIVGSEDYMKAPEKKETPRKSKSSRGSSRRRR